MELFSKASDFGRKRWFQTDDDEWKYSKSLLKVWQIRRHPCLLLRQKLGRAYFCEVVRLLFNSVG